MCFNVMDEIELFYYLIITINIISSSTAGQIKNLTGLRRALGSRLIDVLELHGSTS